MDESRRLSDKCQKKTNTTYITYMWNLREKIKHNKNKFMDTENKQVVTRREEFGGVCKIGEGEFRGTELQL